jgi:NAD(P)H dehydrogenase (quinone)
VDGLIAVTGATGFVGGRVARLLAERGVRQRLVVRDPTRAPDLPGAEARGIAGYGAYDDVTAALDGVDTLFLVPAHESADRLEQHRTAVRAAADAGVRRIVYLSFVDSREDATFTLGRHHWATEQAVEETGVAWTFPRMNLYLDFLPFMVTDGAIEGPAGDGRAAFVARSDIADAVAVLLTTPGHEGRTYDLTGPRAVTLTEVATVLAERSGRPVTFRNQTIEEAYASRASYDAPDWQVEAWVSTYTSIAAGDLADVSDDGPGLTGRPATSLEDYLDATPEALETLKG